jgi:hypothetical protein
MLHFQKSEKAPVRRFQDPLGRLRMDESLPGVAQGWQFFKLESTSCLAESR